MEIAQINFVKLVIFPVLDALLQEYQAVLLVPLINIFNYHNVCLIALILTILIPIEYVSHALSIVFLA